MDRNEIIVRDNYFPENIQEFSAAKIPVFVEYEQTNDNEYVFISRPVQDTEIRLGSSEYFKDKEPAEQAGHTDENNKEKGSGSFSDSENVTTDDQNSGSETIENESVDDVIDVEFEEYVPEKERTYYSAAIACGLLTGILSEASSVGGKWNPFSLSEKKEEAAPEKDKGRKQKERVKFLKTVIVYAARLDGFKGKDYKKAVQFLVRKAGVKIAGRFHGSLADVIGEDVELSARPSLSGLIFSILVQFTEKLYYVDGAEAVQEKDVPEYYVIGDSYEDKLLLGILYWFFYAAAEAAILENNALSETPIPGALKNLIKNIASRFNYGQIPVDFRDMERKYSEWLESTVVRFDGDDKNKELRDLFREKMSHLCQDLFPVLLNNCLVRAVYFLCRIRTEAERNETFSFADLLTSDKEIFSRDSHRILSNMCLISSGAFAAANIGRAILKVYFKSKEKPKGKSIRDFVSSLNIAGIGSFLIAFAENTRYTGENVEVFLNNVKWAGYRTSVDTNEYPLRNNYLFEQEIQKILDAITFDEQQLRIVHSFERRLLEYDIDATTKKKEASLKKRWLREWEKAVTTAVSGEADDWFIGDEQLIFDELNKLSRDPEKRAWIYLLILELEIFTPYSGIEIERKKDYSGLKIRKDYIENQLIRKLTVATQDEADRMKKLYRKYIGIMNGSTQRKNIGTGTTILAATIMGGTAFVFAPGIAVALVGGTFSGLYGAALTNASLAMLGGGSLAAGGFGMAGGTAVITGGGMILGASSSKAMAMAALMLTTSEGLWNEQYARLLTFGRYILRECMHDENSYRILRDRISDIRKNVENILKEMKKEKNSLDENVIKLTESFLKYLRKLDDEMKKK